VTPLDESLAKRLVRRQVVRSSIRQRNRWFLFLPLLALSAIVVLLIFRQRVLTQLGESLVVSDPLEHADLIYVLAGDFWGSRVLLGADLGSKGWAPRVILSGGRYEDRYAGDMSVKFVVEHGYPRGAFIPIRIQAQSTVDEARAMGPIFERLGARRIILVTSNFHSRRAAQVFRLFLPQFDFRMEAAPDDTFDPESWWKKPQERHLVFAEYEKMLGTFLVRFHLASAGLLRQVRP
jgi:uncharacterized SAM-binding protein YcdF (DUF218 family)